MVDLLFHSTKDNKITGLKERLRDLYIFYGDDLAVKYEGVYNKENIDVCIEL
jgi:hypothetical protein